jgi:hypothetical protein
MKDILYAIIRGSGPFPVDMLRYDNCSPATESDSGSIVMTFQGWDSWEICVKRINYRGRVNSFTLGRWNSFGCSLEMVDSPYVLKRN